MVTKAEYRDWFDSDGRLVKEARMRQRLFEAGVDPSCRCNKKKKKKKKNNSERRPIRHNDKDNG